MSQTVESIQREVAEQVDLASAVQEQLERGPDEHAPSLYGVYKGQ